MEDSVGYWKKLAEDHQVKCDALQETVDTLQELMEQLQEEVEYAQQNSNNLQCEISEVQQQAACQIMELQSEVDELKEHNARLERVTTTSASLDMTAPNGGEESDPEVRRPKLMPRKESEIPPPPCDAPPLPTPDSDDDDFPEPPSDLRRSSVLSERSVSAQDEILFRLQQENEDLRKRLAVAMRRNRRNSDTQQLERKLSHKQSFASQQFDFIAGTPEHARQMAALRIQKWAKQILSRRMWKVIVSSCQTTKESKKVFRRHNTIKEIVTTERVYVSNLARVVEFVLQPLRLQADCVHTKPVLKHDQIYHVFSNIDTIYTIHQVLLRDLEARMNDWPWVYVGDLFLWMAPIFAVYAIYIDNFNKAVSTLESHSKDKKSLFGGFLKEREGTEELPLHLPDYLIMPVQRIPRYVLLLQELIEITPEDHIEHRNLSAALEEMRKIANSVNAAKKKSERVFNVLHLHNSMSGAFPHFAEPWRELLLEGVFEVGKKSAMGLQTKPLSVFLMTDIIVMARKKEKDKYQFKDLLQITPLCMVQEMTMQAGSKSSTALQFSSDSQLVYLHIENAEERKTWLAALHDCISAIVSDAPSRGSVGRRTSVWGGR